MDECLALLGPLCGAAAERRRFRELFAAVTGLDPLTAPAADLAARAERAGAPTGLSGPQAVDYLMAVDVEPALDPAVLTVVTDFPGWAAALAQTTEDGDGARVARRFEIYHRGLELANGYQELLDADEQARRFERDNEKRRAAGKRTMTPDPYLLAALAAGCRRAAAWPWGWSGCRWRSAAPGALSRYGRFPASVHEALGAGRQTPDAGRLNPARKRMACFLSGSTLPASNAPGTPNPG